MKKPTIELNHRRYPHREGMTAGTLMKDNSFVASFMFVRINGEIIEEEQWDSTDIAVGDKVEMVHVFGGG